MSDNKRYQTRSKYLVMGARLIRNATVEKSKKGDEQVRFTTVEKGMYEEGDAFVNWYITGGNLEPLKMLQKGDLVYACVKPHIAPPKEGKPVNINIYAHASEINFAAPLFEAAPAQASEFPEDEVTAVK